MEHPADHALNAGQGPVLIVPTVRSRAAQQRRLQPGEARLIQCRQRGRALGGQCRLPAMGPGAAPAVGRHPADPQLFGHLGIGVAAGEQLGRAQPDLFSFGSLFGGQPAALRIPHALGIPPQPETVT